MSTSEGKCVLAEVGALISWYIYSYRIVMLLVPYMWASMMFLPYMWASMTFWPLQGLFNLNVCFKRLKYSLFFRRVFIVLKVKVLSK